MAEPSDTANVPHRPRPEGGRHRRARARARAALLGVLFVGLALRATDLDFGLPEIDHPDELPIVEPAMRIATERPFDPDPRFYNYPSLQIYVLALSFYLKGAFSAGGSLAAPEQLDPIVAIQLARWVTTAFGVATVAVLYAAGAACGSHTIGLLAALLLAITPFHVMASHYANVDVPMTLWLVVALLFAYRHVRRGRNADYILAAVAVGLAAATKYTALAALAVVPAMALTARQEPASVGRRLRLVLVGVLAAAAAFFVCMPYALLETGPVLEAIGQVRTHMARGHWGWDILPGGWINHRFVYQLLASLPFMLGLPLYLVALAGIVAAARRRRRPLLIAGAIAAPIFVVVCLTPVVFPRYLLPILPPLVLAAAALLAPLFGAGDRRARMVATAVLAVTLAYTGAFTASLLAGLEPQNATRAAGWITDNVRPGSPIGVGIIRWTLPLAPERYRARRIDLDGAIAGDRLPPWLVISGFYDKPWARGHLRQSPGHRFLAELGSPTSPYEEVARFRSRYLTEELYAALDPNMHNQFMSPDFTIYRRRPGR